MAKSIGAKIIRAFFIGQSIGLVGGLGMFILAKALNVLAGSNVLDPTSMLLLTDGIVTVASIGVELSKDLAEQ